METEPTFRNKGKTPYHASWIAIIINIRTKVQEHRCFLLSFFHFSSSSI